MVLAVVVLAVVVLAVVVLAVVVLAAVPAPHPASDSASPRVARLPPPSPLAPALPMHSPSAAPDTRHRLSHLHRRPHRRNVLVPATVPMSASTASTLNATVTTTARSNLWIRIPTAQPPGSGCLQFIL